MKDRAHLTCLLLDPSLFTAPYDAALDAGLRACGVETLWAVRPARRGEQQELPASHSESLFYRRVDDAIALPAPLRVLAKGLSHGVGLARLMRLIARRNPDVIHVQWVVLPLLDVAVLWLIRLRRPIILTVHDPVPFNGQRLSWLQRLGFDLPIKLANRVIVHSRSGRQTLIQRGIAGDKIAVVPHGPLSLRVHPQEAAHPRDSRWTFVLFGEIKPYKGLDVLVEALALLSPEVRGQVRLIVAGRPRMNMADITSRIEHLGLQDTIELQPRRISEQEMADLFAAADCFVFPYREIDASGVYFLVKGLGKWIIASRVGVFGEEIAPGIDGSLVPSNDPQALARELQSAALQRPTRSAVAPGTSWADIGGLTRSLYQQVLHERARRLRIHARGDVDA